MAKSKTKNETNEIQVFEDFTDDEVLTISKYSEKKFFQRDEIVFEEKSKDDSLYVVLKGRLQAFAHTENGDKIPLSHIEQGEVFGELSFLDGKQRSATILAVEDVELLQLTRKQFQKMSKSNPTISSKLISDLARVVSLRLRNADKFIVDIFQLINKDKEEGKAKTTKKLAPKVKAEAKSKVKATPAKAVEAKAGKKENKFKGVVRKGRGKGKSSVKDKPVISEAGVKIIKSVPPKKKKIK